MVPAEILAVFPRLDETGGVETSGRIVASILGRRRGEACHVFEASTGRLGSLFMRSLTLVRAARAPRPKRAIIAWHLGFLKLVPLLDRHAPRVVLFLHGVEAWHRQSGITSRLLDRVDLFLSNTDHTWTRFVTENRQFAGRHHRTVHLGVGSPASAAASPKEPPTVIMVSRLRRSEDYKGHREVISCWPEVVRVRPEMQLVIVGDGDLRPHLEGLARDVGVGDRVTFVGGQSEEAKERLISSARCLAMPSRGEGFGLVYLEAMRLGRPCLVSDIDAGKEVIAAPEAGLAVDPSDARALADALLQLTADNRRWTDWSRAARRRYESHFTESAFENRLLAALEDVF